MKHRPENDHRQPQRNWAEICCFGCTCLQLFWPKLVMRKWLNINTRDSDYSADTDDEDTVVDSDVEEEFKWPRESRFRDNYCDEAQNEQEDALPRIRRRRKSETFRAQYINSKELRICCGTWNVGGILPPEDLDIEDWLDIREPADIYVIGFQEIIPLNAGNIFGSEDTRPVPIWENIIRETLNKVRPVKTKFKCFSDPPSPSKFKPSDDAPYVEDELLLETDSEDEEEIHPLTEDLNGYNESVTCEKVFMHPKAPLSGDDSLGKLFEQDPQQQFSSPKKLDRLNCLQTEESTLNSDGSVYQQSRKLNRTLSRTDRIGLSWPEPSLNLLGHRVLEKPNSSKSFRSFKASKSFQKYSSFKSYLNGDNRVHSEAAALLAELDLEALMYRKRRPPFVRIVSKQMVGVFLTIWVRRSLRRHIQNLKVSTVGVGVMGFIGNKGSISVSMSIYHTLVCFICTHLTSGEKDTEAFKRNADVHEIHRRTHFHPVSSVGLPKSIHDHEKIFWLGDLNYRLNLSYDKARELISRKEWSKLVESDQLIRELRKGRAFDGWSEGLLNFPPTYKYEMNSDKYYGEDPKVGRRTPAWCDRVLSFGKGMKLLYYRRAETRLSDHRPVTASYMVEVEVFSPRKLQRALTFTDAEVEGNEFVAELGLDVGTRHFRVEQDDDDDDYNWEDVNFWR